ncbi:Hypothetical predicted protein [Mytilus galloprovincialis]|uniref:Heparanase n=1 Tax=Mytilus galloprovincialis TaxID=29158 RepID=A0A8B6EEM6_MYTGA|nr:Hypothetical predicted protein [Mytilus galloprovincialis]
MLYKTILLFVLSMMKMTYSEYGTTSVKIDTDTVLETIPDRFLSVTLDTSTIQANWATLNLSSPKVHLLAKALSPCYLRVGGSSADYLQFNQSSESGRYPKVSKEFMLTDHINNKLTNFTMIPRQWDELNHFVEEVGWDLIFDLNSLLRQNGQWSPANAKQLMDYTTQKGYKIAGWELGNEPDVYKDVGINITGSQRAKDYNILHSLLNHYPQWRDSVVIGPSVTMLVKQISRKYLQDFVDAGGPDIVTNPTFHQWLDKLGISASLGVDVVVRQTFYGGNYGLIDTKTSNPNPDFWLSLLYKKLVGRSVFNVTMENKTGYVRMYTHCTNTQRSGYKPGSITVYGMNLRSEPTTVVFPQFKPDIKLHLYLMEPVGVDSLKSQTVALNGRTLSLNPDFSLPSMDYPEVVTSNFTFPQESFGFIVIPDANVATCKVSS